MVSLCKLKSNCKSLIGSIVILDTPFLLLMLTHCEPIQRWTCHLVAKAIECSPAKNQLDSQLSKSSLDRCLNSASWRSPSSGPLIVFPQWKSRFLHTQSSSKLETPNWSYSLAGLNEQSSRSDARSGAKMDIFVDRYRCVCNSESSWNWESE